MTKKIPQLCIFSLVAFLAHSTSVQAQSRPEPLPESANASSSHQSLSNQQAMYESQSPQRYRSETTAFALTAGTYVGGWALLLKTDNGSLQTLGALGIVAAPMAGYTYTGNIGKGLGLSALSAIGGTMFVSGVFGAAFDGFGGSPKSGNNYGMYILGGLALHGGVTLYSLYDTPAAARRYNAKQRKIMVMPTPVGRNMGLGVAGTF